MNSVTLTADVAEAIRKLKSLPDTVGPAMAAAMDFENQITVGHIMYRKLSQRGPDTLGVVTNRLRGSVRASKSVVTSRQISSGIGSNVKYAGVHEFGYTGTVSVPGFTRRNKRGDRFALRSNGTEVPRALAEKMGAFTSKGRTRAWLKKTVSGISIVKAHTRKLNFTARHMFQTGIEERLDAYETALSNAILGGISE